MSNFVTSWMAIGSFVVTAIVVLMSISLLDDEAIISAQLVDIDEPPTNATEELDVKIDATEPLPVNGTIIVDISEADDIDIDAIPPEGVSIVVTNTTLTVTNNPVEISEEEASGTPPANAEGLATEPSANTNENEAEGSSDDGGDEGEESANDSDTPDDEEEE